MFFRGRHSKSDSEAGIESVQTQAYDRKHLEIKQSCFKIDTSKCLGSGKFGKVFKGTLSQKAGMVAVAIKMARMPGIGRSHADILALRGLISEIKILSYVGDHKHIVKLYGAYTQKLKSGKLCVFLELCANGSLLNYLRDCQKGLRPGCLPRNNDDNREMLTDERSQDLCRWSQEICSGMEFLAYKKLIHGDLAARNILLNSEKSVKISDFGLSRRLYEYTEYIKQEEGPLPWRWMAPESLKKMIFTEKSDVWAFGITLWEILSLGDEPYPGLSWSIEFPGHLVLGLIPDCPRYADNRLYSIMKRCWDLDPYRRPSFSDLQIIFSGESNSSELVSST